MWAIGCVLAEMLTNHVFFEGSNSTTMLSKIIRTIGAPSPEDLKSMQIEQEMNLVDVEPAGIRERILKLNPDSPLALIEIVEKMVVYNPSKRITAADALTLPVFN